MTGKERIRTAMNLQAPDRVPVMCQLAVGHYFLRSQEDPFSIWYTSDGFAQALLELAGRYRFDGILVNLPGREPDFEKQVVSRTPSENHTELLFQNGSKAIVPDDDNVRFIPSDTMKTKPAFEDVDPEKLFYVEPWDVTEITYPYSWGFDKSPAPVGNGGADFFPPWQENTIKEVLKRAQENYSVHSEVFSPFSQFLELLSLQEGLMALLTDAAKVTACLERLTEGAVCLAKRQAACGVDAILVSSAYAGGGFISRDHYRMFVLPFEKRLIREIKQEFKGAVYTHTCGAIGDRLDLMLETGTCGIDTLDPPPLGTVELDKAVEILKGKAFIKGNMDPVNMLLRSDRDTVFKDAEKRIKTAGPGGGYILSSACSVSPHVSPENIHCLRDAVETFGMYDRDGRLQ